jgi:hypothetical protein
MAWEEVRAMIELARLPWRNQDFDALLPPIGAIDDWMAAYKAEHRDARLVVLATTRPLPPAKRFLHGQLLARFEQAVSRETSMRPRDYLVDPMEEDEKTTGEMRHGGGGGL